MAFQQNQYQFDKNASVSSTFDGNVCFQAPQQQAYLPNSTILESIAFQDLHNGCKLSFCSHWIIHLI